MKLRTIAPGLMMLIVLALMGPASAHGDLQATEPERGSSVNNAPRTVRITFTEPPTADGRFGVRDGCGDAVLAAVGRDGREAELGVDGGEPGRWKVTYRVISSLDGHSTGGSFSFRVKGKQDCSDPQPAATDGTTAGDDGMAAERPLSDSDEAGGGFPIIAILLGGVVVLGAIVVRVVASRSG